MIILENKYITLKINENCIVESLILKENGEELIDISEKASLFSITEERPYNNEIKLAYPNKLTEFKANKVRREGDRLIVGFELIHFEAVVEICERDGYISFTLSDFIVPEEHMSLAMYIPPVYTFRLLNLPFLKRKNFGSWLGVMHDDTVAVSILAASPAERIDSENKREHRLMFAEARRDIKLKGATALLTVTPKEKFLETVGQIEEDYDLPRGVENRLSDNMNRSIFWVETINPENVDEHIAFCKKAGFKMMLIYYRSIFHGEDCYKYIGDYDYLPTYKNGLEDLKRMLQKIREVGILPGIHFLHTHIGIHSRYVTPIPDHRLNLRRHLTLAKDVGINDSEIYVEENPEGCFIDKGRRILRFNDELIHYESYTATRPYLFKGCERGYLGTYTSSHKRGTIGGLLDTSEYGAWSIYIDQESSLQDEIAEKLGEIYNAGFAFAYFDGSEGTNSPYDYNVANAQYKVYKKFLTPPIFAEAAAKSHFSWHMISGGNAFDVFPPNIFKEKINEFPLDEAPKAANDFTRVDFGWWRYALGVTPDMYEYGTSRAAAWDCPVTVAADMKTCRNHPRTDDIFDILKNWEEVREKKLLTEAEKEMLKATDTEHILIKSDNGEYSILPYYKIEASNDKVSAYIFEKDEKSYVVCWHNEGKCRLTLPLKFATLETAVGRNDVKALEKGDSITFEVSSRLFISSDCGKDSLIHAFKTALYEEL